MLGLGIMSGSSLDGLDIALVEFEIGNNIQWTLHRGDTFPLTDELKTQLKQAINANPFELAAIESAFSKFVVDSIHQFNTTHRYKLNFIAIHGHTLLHLPALQKSVQIINAAYVAEHCKLPTVTDFRNNDMAWGGQGTPMAVIADKHLFSGNDYYLNLGGIANISYLDSSWQAYDLFPFNQVLNHFAHKLDFEFDRDGQLASQGTTDEALLKYLLTHDYTLKKPPKSLDNTQVKSEWINAIEAFDLDPTTVLKTFVVFTCSNISSLINPATSLFITGGGAKNKYFIDTLNEILTNKSIDINVPETDIVDFKEAILIAFAGALRLRELPNFIADATGATRNTIGGAVYLPSLYE